MVAGRHQEGPYGTTRLGLVAVELSPRDCGARQVGWRRWLAHARSAAPGEDHVAIALGACYRHAAEPARARCPDCQRNICCACFGAAAWPWKVCSECEPKRVQTA